MKSAQFATFESKKSIVFDSAKKKFKENRNPSIIYERFETTKKIKEIVL